MKHLSERRWLVMGFGIAVLLMGVISASSHQNAVQLIESTHQSKQTYEVIKRLMNVFATMTVAESGRRGYVFLGDETELNRYHIATQTLQPELQALHQLVKDDPTQIEKLAHLEALLKRRMQLLQQSIDLYQRDRQTQGAQSNITAQSIQLRDQIQQMIAEMQTEEEHQLQQWLRQSQDSIQSRNRLEFVMIFFSLAILLSVYALLYRQFARQQQAEAIQLNLAKEKELSELKVQFFSMVSHEFRTPLSVILGSAQLLANSGSAWSEARKLKNLDRIQSSAKLLSQLLNDLLTLTRAEAGGLECHPQPLDIEAFCLNLVDEMQLSSQSTHPIQFISQGGCAHVCLDEKLLYLSLSNLLSNAIKYSSPQQPIEFILSCQPDATVFQIKDQGRGIPIADRANLYQPFYRSQTVLDTSGTGLGLAVVKKCVELHQGEIRVESAEGSGTTMTIHIPQAIANDIKSD